MIDASPPKGPVLVAGGHRGVGYELARLFADRGHDLVLVGRDGDRLLAATESLEAESGVLVMPMAVDLAEPGAAADLHERLVDRGLSVAGVVYAAGRRVSGPVTDHELEAELGQVRTNALAPVEVIGRALPGMLERGEGAILTVASVAAFYVRPGLTGYHASQAFLLRYTRGLAAELRNENVAVTALCPETTAGGADWASTTGDATGRTRDPNGASGGEDGIAPGSGSDGETGTPAAPSNAGRGPRESPRSVAEAGVRGLEQGRTVVVPGVRARALVTMLRVLPDSVVRRWASWAGRKRVDG